MTRAVEVGSSQGPAVYIGVFSRGRIGMTASDKRKLSAARRDLRRCESLLARLRPREDWHLSRDADKLGEAKVNARYDELKSFWEGIVRNRRQLITRIEQGGAV
jgi:hypothetical protein